MFMSHINDNNLVSLETGKKLKVLGYDKLCNASYITTYTVKPEIREKYPFLEVDDGTYDSLLKKHGGDYDEKDVYGYCNIIYHDLCRNVDTYERYHHNFICAAPTYDDVLRWLIETESLYIDIYYSFDYSDKIDGNIDEKWQYWTYQIIDIHTGKQIIFGDEYDSYDDALKSGIDWIIKRIILN